jgi:hypothetical protein
VARARERVWSGSEVVLVDEPAEDVSAVDRAGAAGRSCRARRREVETAMRSAPVVMADVLGEDPFEVASGEHE